MDRHEPLLSAVMIRAARDADLAALATVQRNAGTRFRAVGMGAVADRDPERPETLRAAAAAGLLWVAVDDDDRPSAFLLASLAPGAAHVEQVSVDPRWAGRGIGAILLDHLAGWAAEHGLTELTLTTFADVPWNAPYYERLGFVRVPEAELRPSERQRTRANAAGSLGAWPRVAMRRPVQERVR